MRLVAERLVPSADAPVFHQAATPGEAGAARTRDWIDAARTWAIEGTEVPIDAWAAHVRQGAVQVLDADARRRDAREAARDLLGVLLGDQGLAEACAAPQGFDQLTRKVPSDRKALSEALFRTAQLAGDDAWLDAYAGRLGSAGVPLLVKSLLGWDVRPATGRKTSGA